jgi:hypothetical protein
LKRSWIRGKRPSAIAAAVPTVIVYSAVMTVIVFLAVLLTASGITWAAVRRRLRGRNTLSNRYMLPEGYQDFNSRTTNLKQRTGK